MSVEIGSGRPHHPVELFLLGRVLVHGRGSLLPLNHLLLQLKLLILLKISLVTNIDAVTDVRVGESVMRFSVSEVIPHLERSVRRQFLLALGSAGRNHVETRGR